MALAARARFSSWSEKSEGMDRGAQDRRGDADEADAFGERDAGKRGSGQALSMVSCRFVPSSRDRLRMMVLKDAKRILSEIVRAARSCLRRRCATMSLWIAISRSIVGRSVRSYS